MFPTTTSSSTTTSTTEAPPDPGTGELGLAVNNDLGVQNGGTSPSWIVKKPLRVTKIQTYHWNDAHGAGPGTIGLRGADGTAYGPWQAEGVPGMNDVPNAYWVVNPNQVVEPGVYKVIDSDPATWSQNSESQGLGFTFIFAEPAD